MSALKIGEFNIEPGEKRKIELPVAKLYTDVNVSLPVHIIRAKKPGPIIFVSAAIHGDELNGIEIIRRLISHRTFNITAGTLIAVPMVNVYGVMNQSRYLPDRRDLNRCFPGSAKGSLAARVAHIFMTEIVSHCEFGIDLHTGAIHRSNFPQIRADLSSENITELAQVFGVPVVLNSDVLEGSLRAAAHDNGTKVLLYEAGEALRFDEFSIRAGVKGILNVMQHLGMIRKRRSSRKVVTPFIANHSSWIRANCSGIVSQKVALGEHIKKNMILAEICSPYGEVIDVVRASRNGILIGKQNIPLVQEGEAMFHIAFFSDDYEEVAENIEVIQELLLPST